MQLLKKILSFSTTTRPGKLPLLRKKQKKLRKKSRRRLQKKLKNKLKHK